MIGFFKDSFNDTKVIKLDRGVKMNIYCFNMKRKINDHFGLIFPVIATALGLYAYLVYVVFQSSYLKTFGLRESTGLIKLNLLSVITVVTKMGLLTLFGLFFVVLLTKYLIVYEIKTKNTSARLMFTVRVFILYSIVALPYLLIELILQNYLNFMAAILAIIFSSLFFYKISHVSREGEEYYIRLKKSLTQPIYKLSDKLPKTTGAIWLMASMYFLAVMLLVSYEIGAISARTKTTNYIAVIEQRSYILVQQYENELILVNIENNVIMPKFRIEYIDSNNPIEFEIRYGADLDFNQVANNSGKELLEIANKLRAKIKE